MTIPKQPVFQVLLTLSVISFLADIAIHLLALVSPNTLAPYGSAALIAIVATFTVLFISFTVIHDSDPQIRLMRKKNPLGFQFSLDYYRTLLKLSFEFTPIWAVVVLMGLFVYGIIRVFSMWFGTTDQSSMFGFNTLLFLSGGWAFFYWGNIWFWHTQVARLEKPRAIDENPTPM